MMHDDPQLQPLNADDPYRDWLDDQEAARLHDEYANEQSLDATAPPRHGPVRIVEAGVARLLKDVS